MPKIHPVSKQMSAIEKADLPLLVPGDYGTSCVVQSEVYKNDVGLFRVDCRNFGERKCLTVTETLLHPSNNAWLGFLKGRVQYRCRSAKCVNHSVVDLGPIPKSFIRLT